MACCVWLLSDNIMFSKFILVVACISTSFLFMAEKYSLVGIICIYSSIDGHVGCFYLWPLWVILLWTFRYKFLCVCTYQVLVYGLSSPMAYIWSDKEMVNMKNRLTWLFLLKFPPDCTFLYSYSPPYSYSHLSLLSFIWIISIKLFFFFQLFLMFPFHCS